MIYSINNQIKWLQLMFNPQVSNPWLDSRHSNDPAKRSLPRLPQVMTLIIITSSNSSFDFVLFHQTKDVA